MSRTVVVVDDHAMFRAGVHARVKKGAQKPPVAQQHAQKLVVININIVKARGVE